MPTSASKGDVAPCGCIRFYDVQHAFTNCLEGLCCPLWLLVFRDVQHIYTKGLQGRCCPLWLFGPHDVQCILRCPLGGNSAACRNAFPIGSVSTSIQNCYCLFAFILYVRVLYFPCDGPPNVVQVLWYSPSMHRSASKGYVVPCGSLVISDVQQILRRPLDGNSAACKKTVFMYVWS